VTRGNDGVSAAIAGYVLAGGGSTRFGRDKALVEFDGKPMLLRMCELVEAITGKVEVVAAQGKYSTIHEDSIPDRWPGEGPLGGIITALQDAREQDPKRAWCLIVGCDMPFLTREWLGFLVERALTSDAEVVAPRSAQGLEPLCACWRVSSEKELEQVFESGIRKVTAAMKHLKMEVVDEAAWKRFDSAGRLFWNMNTAAEYDEARRLWEAEPR